ncbi:hypothetical protein [Simiduia sp. 21SJ11W-1]|nr:hypothetical protein [Simiduia sp. 21SJ11W-1]
MSQPTRAANQPYVVDVEAGKTYFWCACGFDQWGHDQWGQSH